MRIAEGHHPTHVVQGRTDTGEFPIDHGEHLRRVRGAEDVGDLKVTMKDADPRSAWKFVEQFLPHNRGVLQALRVCGSLEQPIPAHDVFLERHRLSEVRCRGRINPMNAGQRCHRLTAEIVQLVLGKRRPPLVGADAQDIPVQPWDDEIRTIKPLQVVTRPSDRTMGNVRAIEGIQHLDLTQHIRSAAPIHVGRRQPNEPRFNFTALFDAKAVRKSRVAWHLDDIENVRASAILLLTERTKAILQFV